MATLRVDNFPDDLYQRLRDHALRNKRSTREDVIFLIEKALGKDIPRKESLKALRSLTEIRNRYVVSSNDVDSLTLLREDRER